MYFSPCGRSFMRICRHLLLLHFMLCFQTINCTPHFRKNQLVGMTKMDFFVELALCKYVLHLPIIGHQLFPATDTRQNPNRVFDCEDRFGLFISGKSGIRTPGTVSPSAPNPSREGRKQKRDEAAHLRRAPSTGSDGSLSRRLLPDSAEAQAARGVRAGAARS